MMATGRAEKMDGGGGAKSRAEGRAAVKAPSCKPAGRRGKQRGFFGRFLVEFLAEAT